MCEYVTATLPLKSDTAILLPLFERYGFTIEPLEAAAARRLSSELYFRPTKGHCDCGTFLGSAKRARLSPEELALRQQAEVAELRKKRWSESKIERWQSEKEKEAKRSDPTKERDNWLALIRTIIVLQGSAFLGLMVHSYEGSIAGADLPMGKPKRVLLSALNGEILETMEDGILYRFVDSKY